MPTSASPTSGRAAKEPPVVDPAATPESAVRTVRQGEPLPMTERRLAVFVRDAMTRSSLAGIPIHAQAEFAPLFGGGQAPQAKSASTNDFNFRTSLGVLVSDHAGFVSFDLERVRSIVPSPEAMAHRLATMPGAPAADATGLALVHLWVAPGALDLTDPDAWVDALLEGTGAGTPIVVLHLASVPGKFASLEKLEKLEKDSVGRAMQTPSLDEWYLSPGSFALAPSVLIGVDGCENILPSNVATQEFRFRHLARQKEAPRKLKAPTVAFARVGAPGTELTVHLGYALDYVTTWYPIGHGLGEVAYSLPLAPCESVNIAMIDWSRRDDATRHEDLSVDEQLRHNLLRDRSINETVKATLDEWQRGGSIMGGMGAAGGGSMGVFSAGGTAALGGAYTTSSGTRDLAASTVQNLSDSVAQASSASRKLDSTIVIQDMQLESATAKTRVVTNHNHAHAMTVLYYEVMRHFRVATEWVAQRPVAFISYDPIDLKVEATVLRYRQVLQAVLIDGGLAACFDALQKLACFRLGFDPSLIQDPPDQREMVSFEVIVRTGGPATAAFPYINLRPVNGPMVTCSVTDPVENFAPQMPNILPRYVKDPNSGAMTGREIRTQGEENVFTLKPDVRIVWGDIKELVIGVASQSKGSTSYSAPQPLPWKIDHLVVKSTSGDIVWQLYNGALPAGMDSVPVDGTVSLTVTPIGGAKTPESLLTPDERCCIDRLFTHLANNATYYNRAIWLAEDPDDRAVRFDQFPGVDGTGSLLDQIENRPVGTLGHALAFPYAGPGIDRTPRVSGDRVASERLVSLPTRGLFAEAMLGHCPSAEQIDPTLFTDWAASPCPEQATAINPVDTGSRAQAPNLTPSQLPNPVVTIVNPPAAPDPVGLAAALKVLGTPNIFRDMSGVQELSQLLQTLVNDATALAKPGGGVGGAGSKTSTGTGSALGAGGGMGGGGTSGAGAGSGGSGTAASPGTPRTVGEVNDLASGIRQQLPPAQANPLVGQLYQNVVDKASADNAGGLITDPSLISGALFPVSLGSPFPTGPDHDCFPVSMFQTSNFASGFGTIAERMIENDYCDTFACSPSITYKDDNNPTEYRKFLVDHNPTLATKPLSTKLAGWVTLGISRPDILCDDGVRKDYYEIKPFSPSGAVAGVGKLALIVGFMADLKLPYVPGTTYSPSKDIPIMWGTMLGSQVGVSLNVQRHVPGIVTYTICLTGEVHALLLKATLTAILAYIAAQLLMMTLPVLAVA
uniref:Uncharacterized protein n=2 Tax=Polaromonas sp. H8N TaxID=1840297 RepID=A0A2S1FJC8_9BURK|nr:hypothetical protein pH8NP2_p022 [Polaromonas sp. H8N]